MEENVWIYSLPKILSPDCLSIPELIQGKVGNLQSLLSQGLVFLRHITYCGRGNGGRYFANDISEGIFLEEKFEYAQNITEMILLQHSNKVMGLLPDT